MFMGLYAPLMLLLRVVEIFTGFTFTDLEDFVPLVTLLIGVVGAALLSRSRKKPATKSTMALMSTMTLWPILPTVGLYFLARTFQSVNGNWPQVMVDDPKSQLGSSPQFDDLFYLIPYLEALSGAWMISFLVLAAVLWDRFSRLQRRLLTGLTLFFLAAAIIDFGGLNAWWMD